ncbi:MAG: S8 family serine peptidase [Gammaproteobacteria bacterium]|nr:S8 family serine peptidase [Gammaproteobacteria bacterium]MBT7328064.1 S8 family serine peptidase [Gammaproteobacteria bacterium]
MKYSRLFTFVFSVYVTVMSGSSWAAKVSSSNLDSQVADPSEVSITLSDQKRIKQIQKMFEPEHVSGELLVKIDTGRNSLWTRALSTVNLSPGFADVVSGLGGSAEPLSRGAKTVLFEKRGLFSGQEEVYQVSQLDEHEIVNAVKQLEVLDSVVYIEPNFIRRPFVDEIASASTDPGASKQWHLNTINAPQGWNELKKLGIEPGGSRDMIVAVIDTGVDLTHEDLDDNLWVNSQEIAGDNIDNDGNGYVDDVHGVSTVSNQHSGDPTDDHGHGTHVAGIVAAEGKNHLGGVGVAYNARIMSIKAAQYSGIFTSADIAEAIYYAYDHGATVINMSFGGYGSSQTERDAMQAAFGSTVLVAAAGNNGKWNDRACTNTAAVMYPAAYPWVLSVMARKQSAGLTGVLADFSNRDCIAQDSYEYEMMAPGVDIYSTLPGNQYASWDGTSMASPVVAGMAALVRSKFNDRDSNENYIYSSRFIMGQLGATGAVEAGAVDENKKQHSYHNADLYNALTIIPEPDVGYINHWVIDDDSVGGNVSGDADGKVDAGETVELAMMIRNHWGKADDVTVTLAAKAGVVTADPYVTWDVDSVNYGAVSSFNEDDNGITYDSGLRITALTNPFRFTVSNDAPNNHLIPIEVTITAKNGYTENAPAVDQKKSNFYLQVQKGRELPNVIASDAAGTDGGSLDTDGVEDNVITLDNSSLWIVDEMVLISAGVTLKITEGASLQFHSGEPLGPYDSPVNAGMQVEGTLNIVGTVDNPVKLYPSDLYSNRMVIIEEAGNGAANIQYVEITNPYLLISSIDHIKTNRGSDASFLDWKYDDEDDGWLRTFASVVSADNVSNGQFYKMGSPNHVSGHDDDISGFGVPTCTTCLFDGGNISKPKSYNWYAKAGSSSSSKLVGSENVFLNNYKEVTLTYSDPFIRSSIFAHLGEKSTVAFPQVGSDFKNNAILNNWKNPDKERWIKFRFPEGRDDSFDLSGNFWGGASEALIHESIKDQQDDFNLAQAVITPVLTTAPETAYPFVADIRLLDSDEVGRTSGEFGAEVMIWEIKFNRDMDQTIQPQVSFGPDIPYTDFNISGDWVGARTWKGSYNITPVTGDGWQFIRVAGAVAAGDAWLVTGDDSERFRFEVITSGAEAMVLQANAGEGKVTLTWMQDDFDMLAGYNLYRSTTQGGGYTRVNPYLIPAETLFYADTDVNPGQVYYYKFTVVQTSMKESDYSNMSSGAPNDTVSPVITHTAVISAQPGESLTIRATATDNVAVTGATLFYRNFSEEGWHQQTMIQGDGDTWRATLAGSIVVGTGLDYYLTATDGVSPDAGSGYGNPYKVTITAGDRDGDGVPNDQDQFPDDPNYTTDGDSDGMPDAWERGHWGSETVANESTDQDGDGLGDKEEYLLGTDPKVDSESMIVIADVSASTGVQVDLNLNFDQADDVEVHSLFMQLEIGTSAVTYRDAAGTLPNGWTLSTMAPPAAPNSDSPLIVNIQGWGPVALGDVTVSLPIVLDSSLQDQGNSINLKLLGDSYIYDENGESLPLSMQQGSISLSGGSHSYNLAVGWNMVGFPYVPPNGIKGVESAIPDAQSIWNFENNSWKMYDKNNSGPLAHLNNLTSLNSAAGYWILMNAESPNSMLSGQPIISSNQLKDGWNMVAVTADITSSKFVDDNSVKSVWTWDAVERKWRSNIDGTPEFLNSLQTMRPGTGYYVMK